MSEPTDLELTRFNDTNEGARVKFTDRDGNEYFWNVEPQWLKRLSESFNKYKAATGKGRRW